MSDKWSHDSNRNSGGCKSWHVESPPPPPPLLPPPAPPLPVKISTQGTRITLPPNEKHRHIVPFLPLFPFPLPSLPLPSPPLTGGGLSIFPRRELDGETDSSHVCSIFSLSCLPARASLRRDWCAMREREREREGGGGGGGGTGRVRKRERERERGWRVICLSPGERRAAVNQTSDD